jgi:hypothetical protein
MVPVDLADSLRYCGGVFIGNHSVMESLITHLDEDLYDVDTELDCLLIEMDLLEKSPLKWELPPLRYWYPLGCLEPDNDLRRNTSLTSAQQRPPDSIDMEIMDLWDELEMSTDMDIFECNERKHELLSALPEQGLYFVPTNTTSMNSESAQAFWDNIRWNEKHEYDNWHIPPYDITYIGPRSVGPVNTWVNRPKKQDLNNYVLNQIDLDNRIAVVAEMTQFGDKFHTATCDFGRIYVPMKFGRHVGDIGQKMCLLIRVKDVDNKHPFACIKVLYVQE